jgi:restriction system protein
LAPYVSQPLSSTMCKFTDVVYIGDGTRVRQIIGKRQKVFMIPDYQTLMRPVLECASSGEVRISDVVEQLANKFGLTADERTTLLPSGKQTTFANRVNWAKSYLKQAGLVEITGRGQFKITDRGRTSLFDKAATINNSYLEQFEDFQKFRDRGQDAETATATPKTPDLPEPSSTPDEALRRAYGAISSAFSADLLERVEKASFGFFERLIVDLLLAMGYGGTSEEAGRALGQSGDDGVDGVIDQDPLGVDQIYVQAKRYREGNNIGAGAIRDFFGALSLKKAQKGIFVTTSAFSPTAVQTARDLGSRIVLIDGVQLTKLMIRYNVGCRDEEVLHLKKIDEDFFE